MAIVKWELRCGARSERDEQGAEEGDEEEDFHGERGAPHPNHREYLHKGKIEKSPCI